VSLFSRLSSRKAFYGVGLGLALLIGAGLHAAFAPTLLHLESQSGDWVWQAKSTRANADLERRLVMVDIDERSLQEFGPWPWSRQKIAKLVEDIGQQKPLLQFYDLVLPEEKAGDEQLALSIKQYSPIFSQILALETPLAFSAGQLESALDWKACPAPFQEASGYLANNKNLEVQSGHITPRLGLDGVLRHQPAIICFKGKAYPSLAIKAVMAMSDQEELVLEKGAWLESDWMLGSKKMVSNRIPLNANGDVRFPWRLPNRSFISISAADVFEDRYPKDLFKNAVVLVGSSAFGLNDGIATPLSPLAAGMQAHAELVLGLIDEQVPFTPRIAIFYQIAFVLVGLAVLMLLVLSRLPGYWIPVAGLGLSLISWLSFVVLLWQSSRWIGWIEPALFLLLTSLIWSGLEHARSRLDRDRLYQHLSSYLPSSVAAALALQSPSDAITAKNQSAVVLFADIRNFSAYCEVRPPEESAAILHAFFSSATKIVEQHGGVIEAFEGDALIAFWGNLAHHDGADLNSPLRAAVALQKASLEFLPDPAPDSLEPLVLGIGLELGSTMIGSFGLAKRRAHLILGPTVSITSCLVKMTAELSHPILIGGEFAKHIHHPALQSLGIFLLDGLKTPHSIFAYPHSDDASTAL
jgi:adenylate cyclase